MGAAWEALLICASALAVDLVVHLLAYRITRGYRLSILAGFAAGFLFLGTNEAFRLAALPGRWGENLTLLAGDSIIYICAAFLFFNFINAGETSIRVRILRELRGEQGTLSEEELLARYNDQIILRTRLERLLSGSQIEFVDGRYRLLTPTLTRLEWGFSLLKRLLLRQTSEFGGGKK